MHQLRSLALIEQFAFVNVLVQIAVFQVLHDNVVVLVILH